jgi:hypothetical protein
MENYEEDITKYPTPDKQYEGAMKYCSHTNQSRQVQWESLLSKWQSLQRGREQKVRTPRVA